MLESTFRELFLRQLKLIVMKDANRDTLHELLAIASPDLKSDDLLVDARRDKALRALKRCIHPDKHPDNAEAVTEIFQDVQQLYEKCCLNIAQPSRKKRKWLSSETPKFPREHDIFMKWPFLHVVHPAPQRQAVGASELAAIMAYKCINYRGSIAHSEKTEICYTYEHVQEEDASSVKEIFDKFGGTKVLTTVEDIKQEIMTNGPVVSTSFQLCEEFRKACEYPSAFEVNQTGITHELLIVGWKLGSCGEMWLVEALDSRHNCIPVSVRQFGIDEVCIAPTNNFESFRWQEGPYLSVDISNIPKWRTKEALSLSLASTQLEELGACFNEGFHIAIEQNRCFVLCDERKKAHSRKYRLREVRWDTEKNRWSVRLRVAKQNFIVDDPFSEGTGHLQPTTENVLERHAYF